MGAVGANGNRGNAPPCPNVNEFCAVGIYASIPFSPIANYTYTQKCEIAGLIKNKNIFNLRDTKKRVVRLNDESLLDFLMLMWLDGIHDEYIIQRFPAWLNEQITNPTSVFYDNGGPRGKVLKRILDKFKNDKKPGPFIAKIMDTMKNSNKYDKPGEIVDSCVLPETLYNNIIDGFEDKPSLTLKNFGMSWEKVFKLTLLQTVEGISDIESYSNFTRKNGDNSIYISFDQEYADMQERVLSRLYDSTAIKGTHKPVQNLITIGTLLDPGRTRLQKGPLSLIYNTDATLKNIANKRAELEAELEKNTVLAEKRANQLAGELSDVVDPLSTSRINTDNKFFICPISIDFQSDDNSTSIFKVEIKPSNGRFVFSVNGVILDKIVTKAQAKKGTYVEKEYMDEQKKLIKEITEIKNWQNTDPKTITIAQYLKPTKTVSKTPITGGYLNSQTVDAAKMLTDREARLRVVKNAINTKIAIGDGLKLHATKLMADGLQTMIVAFYLNKPRERTNGSTTCTFGSGDAIACTGYVFYCEVLGVDPNLIIDISKPSNPRMAYTPLPSGFVSSRYKPPRGGSNVSKNGGNTMVMNLINKTGDENLVNLQNMTTTARNTAIGKFKQKYPTHTKQLNEINTLYKKRDSTPMTPRSIKRHIDAVTTKTKQELFGTTETEAIFKQLMTMPIAEINSLTTQITNKKNKNILGRIHNSYAKSKVQGNRGPA